VRREDDLLLRRVCSQVARRVNAPVALVDGGGSSISFDGVNALPAEGRRRSVESANAREKIDERERSSHDRKLPPETRSKTGFDPQPANRYSPGRETPPVRAGE